MSVVIELDAYCHLLWMDDFGGSPFGIGHGRTITILSRNRICLRWRLPIKTLPVGFALQRHQTAVSLFLMWLAVNQNSPALSLAISPLLPFVRFSREDDSGDLATLLCSDFIYPNSSRTPYINPLWLARVSFVARMELLHTPGFPGA